MTYGSDILSDYEKSQALEWLETNGLGGYASGTVSGALTRRYHGLLIAALEPPVKRTVMLSKLDETIVFPAAGGVQPQRYELGTNQYPGAVHPEGYRCLREFNRDLFPVFTYAAGGVVLKKTIAALHQENTTLVLYEVVEAPRDFVLELLPLASSRDHHGICRENWHIGRQFLFDDGVYRTVNYHGGAELFIRVPGSTFVESQAWYRDFEYLREMERGLEFKEDLYTHGYFRTTLSKGDRLSIMISIEEPAGRDVLALFEAERKRREMMKENFRKFSLASKGDAPSVRTARLRLVQAADQFIVRRGNLHTIIAGYHWFSDWGRDTMIALPGLCLTTGRVSIAREILLQFTQFISEGMLPNRFPDHGEHPEYNTFDATLWFFHALYQYWLVTRDRELLTELYSALNDIIAWHHKGTRYGIRVDPADGLLRGGVPGIQLTWMDAKVGDWVVTPRVGKPVEVNALWYNALCIMQVFCKEVGDEQMSQQYANSAAMVRDSFERRFWNAADDCLYDYLDDSPHAEGRPNQIYAVSLPFPLLSGIKAAAVVKRVKEALLTPTGLRSLAPGTPGYAGMCVGGPLQRDGAYHQGTVWCYLVGTYIDAMFNVYGEGARNEASALVNSCCAHLDEACVGSMSEIFDGDWPHMPRGAVAQAWSVAELLRIMVNYNLPG